MAQHVPRLPAATVRPSPAVRPPAAPPEWLCLIGESVPFDLRRLFPGIRMRVATTRRSFVDALATEHSRATEDARATGDARLIVLTAPPAAAADVEAVASWLRPPARRAVLLSAHDAAATRLHALELGFSDAIDLSAEPMEVIGRLSIAGGRPDGRVEPLRIALGGGAELDVPGRTIRRGGTAVPLRPKEYELLEFLATHPGRAFSRRDLLRNVWHDREATERVVDVNVFWLRSKVERDPANPSRLVTVRGSGYRFDPPRPDGREAAER